jgi:anion transporter
MTLLVLDRPGSLRLGVAVRPKRLRQAAVSLLAVLLPTAIWWLPQELSRDGRIALIVLVLAVVGWTLTRLGDALIALAAALALAVTGVLGPDRFMATLGHELIWLLVAAFAMSAVLRASGLLELAVFAVLHRFGTVRRLFLGLTGVIAATAFVVPTTSGRAALMLPVFLALAERMPSARIVRALALLFPTVILLSAGGSLIGAGAHVVAADAMARSTGVPVGFLGWAVVALPFAVASCVVAAMVILGVFLTRDERGRRLELGTMRRAPLTRQQLAIGAIVLSTVGLWATAPVHGLGLALVALLGVAVLLVPGVAPITPREAFGKVNVELIVFLALTLAVGEALSLSGAGAWLANVVVATVPAGVDHSTAAVVAIVALVSLLAHLVIASRTARAAVLIPTLTLPLAALGHDPVVLILVTVLGTGFSQTLPVSAKPVAIFAAAERPTYSTGDLVRLSAALLPLLFALLMLFGLVVWR